ncbi:MAG TPA: A/G-specific adenine glycosylase [Puia sp.]|nr:A/G-specific adenine glycosylase [Puia sp.]
MKSDFTKKLLNWNREENKRSMPWKGEKDPYKIWLSEIILQQTRVEQGTAYYQRFVREFPTIADLASAPEQRVYKLWEGLGYYTRCRNLIESAHELVLKHDGRFPASYEEIRKLRGIGDYTAAAISSFAFNLPCAVVDGNVTRVLSRYFGIDEPVNSAKGKKRFASVVHGLLPEKKSAMFNQAMMDFGALVCKPRNPHCEVCVFAKNCFARNTQKIDDFPVKEKSSDKKKRWLYYIIFEDEKDVLIRKRMEKDIWQNLYEFVLVEKKEAVSPAKIRGIVSNGEGQPGMPSDDIDVSSVFKQELTHQTIYVCFLRSCMDAASSSEKKDYLRVSKNRLYEYPFPKIIRSFLQKTADLNGIAQVL